jgi:hypothetical protein
MRQRLLLPLLLCAPLGCHPYTWAKVPAGSSDSGAGGGSDGGRGVGGADSVGGAFPGDGKDAPEAATDALVECGPGNFCADGGCCVFGVCRKNGDACARPDQIGSDVAGICTNGSCVDNGIGCGALEEACCTSRGLCTAPGSICGLGTGKCTVCGEAGQECCAFGGACSGGGVAQRPHCGACGGPGQICCGEGTTVRKTCDTGVCTHTPGAPGLGDYCPGAPSMLLPTHLPPTGP